MIVVAAPALSEMLAEADPDATVAVCTVTVAPVEVTVGVAVTDTTLFGTVEVYEVVPGAKAGDREPALSTKVVSVLTVFTAVALLTVTVYVFVVVVSCALTTTAIAVPAPPADTTCADDALPDATALPPTDTVAVASLVTGVRVIDDTAFATLVVYVIVPAANAGDSVP